MVSFDVRASLASRPTFHQPAPVGEMRWHVAAEQNDAVLVEALVVTMCPEPFQVIGRGIGVEMPGEQIALDQIRLRRLAQAADRLERPLR